MSSTFFSSIQSKNTQVISTNTQVSMKEGQVVHGTIKKLFPNQTAEVQIGNQKVIAKLETPLKAGDAHFFQVTNSEPELQLKVVSGPLTQGNSLAQQTQQLLQAMNLSKTTEMQAIVQFYLKEQLPISKDILLQVEQLLKQLPSNVTMKEGLEAIRKMTDLKFPLTLQILESVLSGKSTDSLQTLIQDFKVALQQDLSVPSNVKNNLLQTLQKIADPLGEPAAGAIIGKQIEILQNPHSNMSTKFSLLQALKEAEILPSTATLNNITPPSISASLPNSAGEIMTTLKQAPANEKNLMFLKLRDWVNTQSLLTTEQKDQILSLLKDNRQPIQTSMVNNSLVQVFAEQSQQAIFSKDVSGLTAKEHLLSLLSKGANQEVISQTLQQVMTLSKNSAHPFFSTSLQQAEEKVLNQLDGKAFEHAMKEVLKSLGFSYEAKINFQNEDVRKLAVELKPQLVELIQNEVISAPIKDHTNLLLNRMNGLQILSNENGPQHQLLMQVPLEFLGKKMDATLEWNGRMKEDGKIDSDFARVMFYLQLETLEETVVDMQVQNRVVTISLYNNDDRLQPIANMLKESLKEGLLTVGYKLSGVFVKTFEEQKISSSLNSKLLSKESQGVDLRI
ncbi:hypothetical protein ACFVR1_02180 [Psychrobacillus sp. NPDC058041]|uniref:hypothetical protein n=1 Tax=Psychrobacillus sp. NPDC058041 TaxID=3346310 RepID=UPI0036DA0572